MQSTGTSCNLIYNDCKQFGKHNAYMDTHTAKHKVENNK